MEYFTDAFYEILKLPDCTICYQHLLGRVRPAENSMEHTVEIFHGISYGTLHVQCLVEHSMDLFVVNG